MSEPVLPLDRITLYEVKGSEQYVACDYCQQVRHLGGLVYYQEMGGAGDEWEANACVGCYPILRRFVEFVSGGSVSPWCQQVELCQGKR